MGGCAEAACVFRLRQDNFTWLATITRRINQYNDLRRKPAQRSGEIFRRQAGIIDRQSGMKKKRGSIPSSFLPGITPQAVDQ